MKYSRESKSEFTIPQFNLVAHRYYKEITDREFESDYRIIQPTELGVRLLAQNFNWRQGCDINITPSAEDFFRNYEKELDFATEPKGEVRKAFIVDSSLSHSKPIIYLQHGGRRAIFFADSLGMNPWIAKQVAQWQKQTKTDFYVVCETYQRDHVSCHTGALMLCNMATRKDASGNYIIPDLLTFLGKNSMKLDYDFYQVIRLPPHFLVLSQRRDFHRMYFDSSQRDTIIHYHKNRPETLDDFLARNPYTPIKFKIEPTQMAHGQYLTVKSYKLKKIIEIQFYINELQKALPQSWNETLRKEFFTQAKEYFKSKDVTIQQELKSVGLHTFTRNYWTKLLAKLQVTAYPRGPGAPTHFKVSNNPLRTTNPEPPNNSYCIIL